MRVEFYIPDFGDSRHDYRSSEYNWARTLDTAILAVGEEIFGSGAQARMALSGGIDVFIREAGKHVWTPYKLTIEHEPIVKAQKLEN